MAVKKSMGERLAAVIREDEALKLQVAQRVQSCKDKLGEREVALLARIEQLLCREQQDISLSLVLSALQIQIEGVEHAAMDLAEARVTYGSLCK